MKRLILLAGLAIVLITSCKKHYPPEVETSDATEITVSSVSCGGVVLSNGGEDIFEQGICYTSEKGLVPTIKNGQKIVVDGGDKNFSSTITDLSPNTIYYYRAYAINNVDVGYGANKSFKTPPPPIVPGGLPAVSNQDISNLGLYSATLNVLINPNYLETEIWVQYDTIDAMSSTVYVGKINGYTDTLISVDLNGLKSEQIYYFRFKTQNTAGITYGSNQHFMTCLTDIDGNIYKIVKIGVQVWTAENLKTTRYRNGEPIPNVVDNYEWSHTGIGAYCWYLNDSGYQKRYGALYNWYAVDDARELAPEGWHVPSDADVDALLAYLGEEACNKMRATGTEYWAPPNTGATNESGFSALPNVSRDHFDGTFEKYIEPTVSSYWTSNAYVGSYNFPNAARYYVLFGSIHGESRSIINRASYDKGSGYAVRCIKN